MAEYKDREHFIPIHRTDLIDLLASDKGLTAGQLMTAAERTRFRNFCTLLGAHLHFDYQRRLEQLKAGYRPFDPDSDLVPLTKPSADDRAKQLDRLFADFASLLERGNYRRLSRQEIQDATEVVSHWGINLDVDFDAFERLEVFVRGDAQAVRPKPRWWDLLGLFKGTPVKVAVYQRLVAILKHKKHRRFGPEVDTEDVYLKIFKDIPKADLEMSLPGGRVKMTRTDKGLVVYPVVAGVAMTIYSFTNTLWSLAAAVAAGTATLASLTSLGSLASWGTAAAFGGYGYKSYYSFTVKKQAYSLKLTRSLYYQTLDSNAGVLYRLLDEGEEQDAREAILAYYYLWRYAGESGWTAEALDDYVELDLERRANLKVDFEIGDALEKLERFGLVERADDRYRAKPIETALQLLSTRWEGYFGEEPTPRPGANIPPEAHAAKESPWTRNAGLRGGCGRSSCRGCARFLNWPAPSRTRST
jgi:hypothetical protein